MRLELVEDRLCVFELELDSEHRQLRFSEPSRKDLECVLLRRHPFANLLAEASEVLSTIGVMVRKETLHHDACALGLECPPHRRRPSDACNQADFASGQGFERLTAAVIERSEKARATTGAQHPPPRSGKFRDFRDLWLTLSRVDEAEPVRISQTRARLAQGPPGQNVTIPEAGHTIDADNIEIASESVVLEAVVEHQNLGIEERYGMMSHDSPIAPDQHRHSGRMRCQYERLVARSGHARVDSGTVGDHLNGLAIGTLVASTREHDPKAPLPKPERQPGSERRLARSA